MKKYLKIFIAYLGIMAAGMAVSNHVFKISYSNPQFLRVMSPWITVLAVMVVIIHIYNQDKLELHWKKRGNYGTYIVLFLPVAGLAIYSIYQCFHKLSWSVLLVPLMVGIAEEIMFRGILLRCWLQRKTINQAVFLSAICFSLLHMLNFLGGQSFNAVAIQMVLTFLNGLYFALIYVKIKKLSPLILQHCLWDFITFSGIMEISPWVGAVMAAISVAEIIMSIVMLVAYRGHRAEQE